MLDGEEKDKAAAENFPPGTLNIQGMAVVDAVVLVNTQGMATSISFFFMGLKDMC